MRVLFYKLIEFLLLQKKILFTFGPKVFVLSHPVHSNMGDQAQLYCLEKWLTENYPKYKIIRLGTLLPGFNIYPDKELYLSLFCSTFTLLSLRLRVEKRDLFIGHSGYFMIDHHSGWKMFASVLKFFPKNKMIIFPQTINFYAPVIKQTVSNIFSDKKNLLLMCRDEVSYKNAEKLFTNLKLLLYPDIVTSLVGTIQFTNERRGVLFCMRDDIEAFYSPSDIAILRGKLSHVPTELIDTTISESPLFVDRNRKMILEKMFQKFSSFKVVVTDRYHGTIFSMIASTPVVVISSSDHKLSSGVRWFPKEQFGDYITYAPNLEIAYDNVKELLDRNDLTYALPPYFKENYYDLLKGKIQKMEDE